MNDGICKLCGKSTIRIENGKTKRRKYCLTCMSRIRRLANKKMAVELLGDECHNCGYKPENNNYAAFEFHHNDNKEFQVGTYLNRKWDVILKELAKCILLCSNCHRLEHNKYQDDMLSDEVSLYVETLNQKRTKGEISIVVSVCEFCNKEYSYSIYDKPRKFCSLGCSTKAQRKVSRPSKEQLQRDITNCTWTAIGKKYNVSDNAVRKWAKVYGII